MPLDGSTTRGLNAITTAFIVRPFGEKKALVSEKPIEINFDDVEAKLIDKALDRLKITGRTTGEIVSAGNIRDDMFQLLLTRDLVIADVTIQNANVFYELGIRHALRDKWTVMIRGKGDPMPFDNLTDRYFQYDLEDPGAGVDALVDVIEKTTVSKANDSPVFRSLPNLKAPELDKFITIPSEFGGEVEIANKSQQVGDLLLLAGETRGFDWEIPGLRSVGRALFALNAMPPAREVWERVRQQNSGDPEANEWLGTIYQRLAEREKDPAKKRALFEQSNLALQRVLDEPGEPIRGRAEIYSLIARNYKSQWRDQWVALTTGRREAALRSPFLRYALEAYADGFSFDLHHFYSGLNAAAMLTILTSLAAELPDVWDAMFDSDEKAKAALDQFKTRLARLLAGVDLSLEAERGRMELEKRKNIWFDISRADYYLLSIKNRAPRVANAYHDAMAEARPFDRDAAGKQLLIYRDLGLLTENVAAALAEVNPPGNASAPAAPPRTLLFTGHGIDAPGRTTPRFPASKEAEARAAIAAKVDEELAAAAKDGRAVVGLAGGASGGDILFHEVCRERNVPTTIYLAMPRDLFIAKSVAQAGAGWIRRFHTLYAALNSRTLGDSEDLPVWLRRKKGQYTIWDRNNLWILDNAMVNGGENLTVIALWDGNPGDGPGGTAAMVEKANERGAEVFVIDAKTL